MNPPKFAKRVAFCLATTLTLFLPHSARADQVYGRVFVDGQIQPHRSFTVKDSSGRSVRDATTDEYGGYSLFLPPGTYRVEFRDDGATLEATIESYPQPVRQDIYLRRG